MGRRPTLRDYEILYIVRPELDENQVQEAVSQVSTLIQNLGGEVRRTDNWGKRRLAYEVNRLHEGYYVLTEFGIDQPRIPELESTLRISDNVFRHVVVRRPAPSSRAARRAQAATDGQAPAAAVEPSAASPQPQPEAQATPAEATAAEATPAVSEGEPRVEAQEEGE